MPAVVDNSPDVNSGGIGSGTDAAVPPTSSEPTTTTPGPAADNALVSVEVRGVTREYRLKVPTEQNTTGMPLLIAFHGGSGRGEAYPQESQFHQLAESEGFIMAHPLAELLPGNEGEWILNTEANSRDDLDFVEALIDDISARYPVNPQRIYATGYSLGSMFVYELTCHLGDRFAAVASHAGTMPVEPALCAPEGKAAILHIHGADDFLIAYDNTWDWKAWDSVGTMRDVPSLILFWQELYGCQDLNTDDQGATRHVVYDGCEQDLRVEHYRLGGVGHEWPNAINGRSTHEVVWGFVSTFNKQ